MKQDDDLREHFDPAERKKHDHFRLNLRHHRKLRRKVVLAFVSLVIILFLPIVSARHLPFNTLHNLSLEDLTPLGGFLGGLTIVYPIAFLAFLHLGFMVGKLLWVRTRLKRIPPESLETAISRFDLVSFAVHVLAVYTILNAFVFSFATIAGVSMQPTLYSEDSVILFHYHDDYERGDLIVVKRKDENPREDFYIKRLIGLPGETVTIKEGAVWIDADRLFEPYLPEGVATECIDSEPPCAYVLGEDEHFVLGDNRTRSEDSRTMGTFTVDDIYGRVRFRFRPFHRFGRIE